MKVALYARVSTQRQQEQRTIASQLALLRHPRPKCGKPMRIIAFVLERPVIERILAHLGEPTRPPAVRPARPPPQGEFQFDQTLWPDDWPEMDQTAELGDGWE
jgi:hypothetical protein